MKRKSNAKKSKSAPAQTVIYRMDHAQFAALILVLEDIYHALDIIGLNRTGVSSGTTEKIAMELGSIKEHLENLADVAASKLS